MPRYWSKLFQPKNATRRVPTSLKANKSIKETPIFSDGKTLKRIETIWICQGLLFTKWILKRCFYNSDKTYETVTLCKHQGKCFLYVDSQLLSTALWGAGGESEMQKAECFVQGWPWQCLPSHPLLSSVGLPPLRPLLVRAASLYLPITSGKWWQGPYMTSEMRSEQSKLPVVLKKGHPHVRGWPSWDHLAGG